MKRPFNQEKYDIQITVCPHHLTKQKETLLAIVTYLSNELDDEMREGIDGLLNLLDYIQDEVMFRDQD